MRFTALTASLAVLSLAAHATAQDSDDPMNSGTFSGMELRSIGPAFMSGRIADIDIHPDDPSTWYVAVGSGGVWKTENAGTTWTPIFDDQPVYSIGDVTLDPQNPDIVWVGSGENHGGRHIAWGDGIYRSENGGQSWENMGLEDSEHLSTIIVHPEDSDTVYVAAQGPLWSSGGQRGLYRTTDGGASWENVLSAGEWTGVTDVVMDPRDPDVLYAATWQRHRTIAAYMGGGPESGIHRSTDGGDTWEQLSTGLPSGNVGKIGLAISPQDPDVVYAAIELERREGGVWRSDNRGGSWTQMSDTVSGGTGPHYYTELYASPHRFDEIYLVSNTTVWSDDGGANFQPIDNSNKHVDDHAIAFRADDEDYILFGSDGGLYESHDRMANWRYIANLPVTQFYKVAADDTAPFYRVYGGTQDNSTQVGPSRTDNRHGIRNSDWEISVFADGHQPAVEWGNPDIAYGQWQQGNLVRYDATNGELVYIQPQPAPGEPAERFNWDAPILVSRHEPTRLYHGSQRLWRSDDRGDSWTALSPDLTRDQDRMQLPLMGRQWSWDATWDLLAMGTFNTITSIAESETDENVIWIGTDDGLIQHTSDGGATWTRIEASSLARRFPARAYVNDIKIDIEDPNTVYVSLDNHKEGDFRPFLMMTRDGGRSWTNIGEDLPEDHIVWRLVQDHEDPELLFAGTEFGVFFSVDRGENWVELNAGAPTIAWRDLVIQRRENDLVGGTFGRGIYILDDYSPLREIDAEALSQDAVLFAPRNAQWYFQQHQLGFSPDAGSQGDDMYRAENPPLGAVFTYYLQDSLQTLEQIRQESEREANEAFEDTPFPGFDAVERERREVAPEVWLTVRNASGEVITRVSGPTRAGVHRVAWDLNYPAANAVTSAGGGNGNGPTGFRAPPGEYTVELSQRVRGETTQLSGPVGFTVERMNEGALGDAAMADLDAFYNRLMDIQRQTSGANAAMSQLDDRLGLLRVAINRSSGDHAALDADWQVMRNELDELRQALGGNPSSQGYGIQPETVGSRIGFASLGVGNSAYGPTPSHIQQLGWAEEEFAGIRTRLNALIERRLPAFEQALRDAGAPWTPSGIGAIPQ